MSLALHKLGICQRTLLGIAAGDALGMGCEFYGTRKQTAAILSQLLSGYRAHPKWGKEAQLGSLPMHSPGEFSDDLQMSLAVSEVLLGNSFDSETLANQFLTSFQRDQIPGYSDKFAKHVLLECNTGKEMLSKLNGKNRSDRNGAAMRSVPLGFVREVETVIEYARINASITHDTPIGHASATSVALASYYFFHQITGASLFEFVIEHCKKIHEESANHFQKIAEMDKFDPKLLGGKPFFVGKKEQDGIPCHGMYTAGAVLYLLSNFGENAFEVLKQAILLAGDTDSVAAIAGGIAFMRGNLETLPDCLFDDLSNRGNYRRDYILEVGKRLDQKFSAPEFNE